MKFLAFASSCVAVLYGSMVSEIIAYTALGIMGTAAVFLVFLSLYRHFMAMLP